jgi:general L-amino acid transport system permease protein
LSLENQGAAPTKIKIPLWRDVRFWRWTGQGLAVLLIVLVAAFLWGNLSRNLEDKGIELGFDFLRSQASFEIGEKPINYSPADSYSLALLVGLLNSLQVMISGIILTTIVGITVGVARLSDNWLVRNLALVYVETFRNTPLLVQLLFWYLAVFVSLTKVEGNIEFLGFINLSNNGLELPFVKLSPEFSALLAGLTFYTGAFIAEIVRAGIQSVPKGQWEAARSLGLKPNLILRLVVFPQALRVMIPPLTSQYLNLAKNSSLASAIGYPDVYFVASATFNQTGRVVEVMILLMSTYLTISLTISVLMNLLNKSVQLKE